MNDLNTNILEKNSNNLLLEIQKLESKRDFINYNIYNKNSTIKSNEKTNSIRTYCNIVLQQASQKSRENAKSYFEKIVTDALQFVTQSNNYEFVIQELTNRQKTSYEFYIKTIINGEESFQKPEDANGGGFVDIISVSLKFAYLMLFNDPKIMSGTLLYDEPGKMISSNMSIKFAEYLKFLANQYNMQTIMITHNDNLLNIADKTFIVEKDKDNISQVKELKDIDLSDISTMMNNILKDN